MISEDQQPTLREVTNRLRQINSIMRLTSGRAPFWFGRLLSDVILLIDGDSVEYVTGTLGDKSAEIVIVTTHRIVRAIATDIDDDDARATTTVHPRANISSVEVAAEESVYSNSVHSNWPGKLVLVLVMGDSRLTLPLEASFDYDYEPDALRRLLYALLTELDAK